MLQAIKYNLTHLADFSGRDARQTFWYYVLFLVIINIAVSMVMTVPMMLSAFKGVITAAQAGASEETIQAQMASQMAGGMSGMIWVTAALSLLLMVLFIAAFVRRLHDSGKSGWWAIIPVATQLFSVGLTYTMAGELESYMMAAQSAKDLEAVQTLQAQAPGGLYAQVSWIGYIVVIVFGAMKSTPGPNVYGAEPVSF